MKTVTCDRCGRTLKPNEVYRTLSADNFISDLGSVTTLLYCKYPTYDLCERCNADFNVYISKKIGEFFPPKVSNKNDCTTCKYYNNEGLFPCGACDTYRNPDGTIIKTQWESKE